MRVYRIERNGEGPYTSTFQGTWSKREHNHSDGHPLPENDLGIYWFRFEREPGLYSADARFGFLSIAQLEAWFDLEERTALGGLEFKISVYEIDELYVNCSAVQVAFDRSKAELLNTIPLVCE